MSIFRKNSTQALSRNSWQLALYTLVLGVMTLPVSAQGVSAEEEPLAVANALTNVTAISAGGGYTKHTCAIVSGAAKCWGHNENGQLGVVLDPAPSSTYVPEPSTYSSMPTQVNGLSSGVSAISAGGGYDGDGHTCAIVNGAAKCWGDNKYGQLGLDTIATYSSTPLPVTNLTSAVTAIDAGGGHTCAIRNGGAKCWGNNEDGQLGMITASYTSTPVSVTGLSSGVSAISAGGNHTCAIVSVSGSATGAAKCWGNNEDGQLGNNTTTSTNTPVDVTGLSSGVSAISAGDGYTCAIQNGAAVCWGDNYYGQLGTGSTIDSNVPVQVLGLSSGVTAISANDTHTCAIVNGAAAKCWGYNIYGELGDNTFTSRAIPVTVQKLASNDITAITAGSNYTCAIVSGVAQCWGGDDGSMGLGAIAESTTPVQAVGLTSGVSDISVGDFSGNACVVHNGAAKCWGSNEYGQLGNGISSPMRALPIQVVGLEYGVTKISTGSHTCAIQNGAAVCWGNNEYGQLGDGSNIDRYVPFRVKDLDSGVTAINAGETHTCAIHNGAAKCWGANQYGQLGDGSNVASNVPVQVKGMASGVTDISAASIGYYYANYYDDNETYFAEKHSCAVQNGAAKCWGNNEYGQLGNNTLSDSNTPVRVYGLIAGVKAITVGAGRSCAVVFGAAKCWGIDTGNVANPTSKVPVTVEDMMSGVTAVNAGAHSSCAIQSGAAKCWGDGSEGQLGNGSYTTASTPVEVNGSMGTTAINVSRLFACAIVNGAAKCWGANHDGFSYYVDHTTTRNYSPFNGALGVPAMYAIDNDESYDAAPEFFAAYPTPMDVVAGE